MITAMANEHLSAVGAEEPVGIVCEDVHKSYYGVAAVDGISLAVRPGEVLTVVGPSGCGKTTLLRLLAGFEVPDSGTITLGGRVVAGPGVWVPPEARRVGMVFQEYALFPHLTVSQNVEFGLKRWNEDSETGPGREGRHRHQHGHREGGRRRLRGFGWFRRRHRHSEVRTRRVQEFLEVIHLADLAERRPYQLSGGEQQRVALVRSLAAQPVALFMDEPFSNLDTRLREELREEVKAIVRNFGLTTIHVTHDQEEALFMGDRVAVMNQGRIEQVAAPEEVFHLPATRFVAEFMGVADFLHATVTPEGLSSEVGFLAGPTDFLRGARRVEMMVRPDQVILSPSENGIARVVARVLRGSDYLYTVSLPSGATLHSTQHHTVRHEIGDRVNMTISREEVLTCFAMDDHRPLRLINVPE